MLVELPIDGGVDVDEVGDEFHWTTGFAAFVAAGFRSEARSRQIFKLAARLEGK